MRQSPIFAAVVAAVVLFATLSAATWLVYQDAIRFMPTKVGASVVFAAYMAWVTHRSGARHRESQ